MRKRQARRIAGITLIELMIVVVVIGVLGMIALPSYRQYVIRAQRTEAKTALLRLAANQERFYLANRAYASDPAQLGFPTGKSEKGNYALTITDANAGGYTATATPVAGGTTDMMQDAQCTSFSLDAAGVRTATGTLAESCW